MIRMVVYVVEGRVQGVTADKAGAVVLVVDEDDQACGGHGTDGWMAPDVSDREVREMEEWARSPVPTGDVKYDTEEFKRWWKTYQRQVRAVEVVLARMCGGPLGGDAERMGVDRARDVLGWLQANEVAVVARGAVPGVEAVGRAVAALWPSFRSRRDGTDVR